MSASGKIELTPEQKRARKLSFIALFVMIAASVALDQISKIHAQNERMVWSHDTDTTQYQGSSYKIAAYGQPPIGTQDNGTYLYFGFNYVRNQGAAWGVLSDMKDSIRVPFFYMVTVVAVIIITFFLKTTPLSFRLARYTLSLIFSGAIGNFVDRFRLGYVIDWIDVRWNIGGWYYSFPNFNVADSCITVGLFLFFIDVVYLEAKRNKVLAEVDSGSAAASAQEPALLR